MNNLQALVIGVRPPTLLLGISPVLLGSALGLKWHLETGKDLGLLNGLMFFAALLVVVLLQSAANLVNDVKDAESGVDNEGRVGPLRVVQAGLLNKNVAKQAYKAMLFAGVAIGFILATYGGLELIGLALASALAAYLYTGGPKPLSHLGLGEVVALLFFGPVAVLGSAYLQSLTWQWSDFVWSMGPGFLAAAVMAINNLRDRRGDKQVGKFTLAVALSDRQGELLPMFFISMSMLVFIAYAVVQDIWILGLATSILMIKILDLLIRPLLFPKADLLNKALKSTSMFVVLYCILYSILVLL